MPYLGEVMTKTKSVRRWGLRHNLSHLYYAGKFGHWKLVRSMLCGRGWTRVKDVKLWPVHQHDMRGIPITSLFEDEYDKDTRMAFCKLINERKLSDYMSQEDVDKELASRKEAEIDDAWLRHKMFMYGGDDE